METIFQQNMTNVDVQINWREHAMSETLTAEAVGGAGHDALLREIRRFVPGCATATLSLDRIRLRKFLQEFSAGFRSMTPGSDRYRGWDATDELSPYIGWHAAEWRGRTIEVALVPASGQTGLVIFIAEDETHLTEFVKELTASIDLPAGRCLRYAEGWEDAVEMDAQIEGVTWDDVILPAETIAQIRDAAEGFVRNKEAYAAFGFAWRRGILLVGPPGTGKTMICKAIARALPDLPFLYVRDLVEQHNRDAIKVIFERARKLAPCILTFEDLDGLIKEYNRAQFLNELDGFQSNEGLLIIASSNHPGKIDEALLKRPSRFDRVFHIGPPKVDERRVFCSRLLDRSMLRARMASELDLAVLVNSVAERTEGFTPAYLKEVFVSAALQRAHDGAMVLDAAFAEAVLSQVDELREHLKRMKDPDALGEFENPDHMLGFRRVGQFD